MFFILLIKKCKGSCCLRVIGKHFLGFHLFMHASTTTYHFTASQRMEPILADPVQDAGYTHKILRPTSR